MVMLDVFADSYIPEVIIDREKEQEAIKYFLQDIVKGVNKVLACSIYLSASHLTPNLALKEIYEVICGEEREGYLHL